MFAPLSSACSRLAITFLSLAALTPRGLGAEPPDGAITAAEFVAWAKERAVHLDTLDWQSVDLRKLGFLEGALRGKRIVMIGEPDHYISESVDIQLTFIRYLFAKGWRTLGPEGIGPFTAPRINREIGTGDAPLPGEPRDSTPSRPDRRDVHAPLRDDPEFVRRTRRQRKRLFDGLCRLNRERTAGERPLRVIGVDVDHSPWRGYGIVDALVARAAQTTPAARRLAKRLARVKGESIPEEVRRLRDALRFMAAHSDACVRSFGATACGRIERLVASLADSFEFHHALRHRGDRSWVPALRRRERTMMRQMRGHLREPADRIILTGHDFHMGKDTLSMVERGRTRWRSIGTRLRDALPGEVYAIWMLYDSGRRLSLHDDDVVQTVASDPRCIEHVLAQVGEHFVLPLHSGDPREDFLADYRRIRFNARPCNVVLKRNVDAIVFVRHVRAAGARRG